MNNLLALIPLLPLAGFLILSLAGKKLPKNAIAFIGAGSVSAAAVIAIILGVQFMQAPPPGDSYALAEDDSHAIEAYGKAAGMSKDGNVDYVRGSLLLNNDRGKEAVEALRQAVAKGGLKQPGEAYILLGDAENNENNSAAATAAWEKAKGYPSTKTMAEQRLKSGKSGKAPVTKHSKPK